MLGGIFMKKRVLSFLLILILVVLILPTYAFAAGSLSNFAKAKTYTLGQFTDVSDQWFAPNVQSAYEYGLVDGTSPNTFSPSKNLTIAEAIKLAACLNSIYNTGSASFTKGTTPWYQPYVDYALSNGIIKAAYPDYTAYATRSDMAVIFAHALPDEAMTPKNTIDDNAIPDVSIGYSYGVDVYKLYRAGVLVGSDKGVFSPNSNITRDAVAAIVSRMADESLRLSLTLASKELSATEVAAKCAPAVFHVMLLSKTGDTIRDASGFFINSSGLAVTNYHVIKNMTSAKIKMTDGKSYDITGVYDYSEENDLALIQVNGSNFPYLDLADSASVVTGQNIYAIGYPLAVDQTVTPGTITNASHMVDGINYIMINASISSGSSGGALINSAGKVLGVTSASYSAGQNLNLAVPINLLKGLSETKTLVTLPSLFAKTFTYYPGYPTIPDFASVTGSLLYDTYKPETDIQAFVYKADGQEEQTYDAVDKYTAVLDIEGYKYVGSDSTEDYLVYGYKDVAGRYEVEVGIVFIKDAMYVIVMIKDLTQ
jgi:hypothetical protein